MNSKKQQAHDRIISLILEIKKLIPESFSEQKKISDGRFNFRTYNGSKNDITYIDIEIYRESCKLLKIRLIYNDLTLEHHILDEISILDVFEMIEMIHLDLIPVIL